MICRPRSPIARPADRGDRVQPAACSISRRCSAIKLIADAFALMGPAGVFVQFTYGLKSPVLARPARTGTPATVGRGHLAKPATREGMDLSSRSRRDPRRGLMLGFAMARIGRGTVGRASAKREDRGGAAARRETRGEMKSVEVASSSKPRAARAPDRGSRRARRPACGALGRNAGRKRRFLQGGDGTRLRRRRARLRASAGFGKALFLDLKLHDIPNTVARATARIARLGVDFLTVHAYPRRCAPRSRARAARGLRLLGVTALTSCDDADLAEAGYALDVRALVERRAAQAESIGLFGVVAAPSEAAMLRASRSRNLAIVTPGVRPTGVDSGDQKRVATPSRAIADGADYLVVGRPVTGALDPRATAEAIVAEIAAAAAAREAVAR